MSGFGSAGWPRGGGWAPTALVIVALVGAAVIPRALLDAEREVNRELREGVIPARALLAEKRQSFEGGVRSRAAYEISGNPTFLERGRAWKAREDSATARLPALLAGLGPEPRAAWEAAMRLETATDSANAALERREPTRDDQYRLLPAIDARVDSLLFALDRVDAVLEDEILARRERLDDLATRGWQITLALALLGVTAVISVASLTRREQRARGAAETAVRTRDEVVSIVSHDLRNPLSTVSMATSFLLETLPRDAERAGERRQLEIIRRAAENMDHMIQDLLDIARIESGRLSVDRAPTPVPALIHEAVGMLEPIAEKEGKRLVWSVEEGLPPVNADRERMLQIFSNLVGNAVKFTPAGGVITLRAAMDHEAVCFFVSDTGTGIPAEHVPHLFDRFWQANRSDRRGIGLGLPIVKGLVEAHGGQIHVKSEPGRGTTFSFTVEAA